jgi:hypothetical protein
MSSKPDRTALRSRSPGIAESRVRTASVAFPVAADAGPEFRGFPVTHLLVHNGPGSSRGVALAKATPLNMRHATSGAVRFGVKLDLESAALRYLT